MRAVIIGAGVAGPVAALALRRAGIDAVVYESRAREALDRGSYLTLSTNGLDALAAVDPDSPVLSAGFETRYIVLYSGSGRRLGRVATGAPMPGAHTSRTLTRACLHRLVFEAAARQGIPFEFKKRLVDATVTSAGIVTRFDDGTEAVGDVLIGCDGVHSVTRRLIDPAAPAPRYVGLLNFGGYSAGQSVGTAGEWHMIFGRRAFFGYTPDGQSGTVWFANVPRHAVTPTEHRSTSIEAWRQQLLDRFAGDRGPAAQLVSAGRLDLAADNTHDLPSIPRWHRGPMIVIGDAAHAPAPTSGQGAAMAVEDAVVLAQCLRDRATVPDAFVAFERYRRTRVERIVAHGARGSSSKTPGPIGRVLRDLMLPIVFRYAVTEKSMAWIYQHHIDWDTPV